MLILNLIKLKIMEVQIWHLMNAAGYSNPVHSLLAAWGLFFNCKHPPCSCSRDVFRKQRLAVFKDFNSSWPTFRFCSLQAMDCNQQNPHRAYIASVGQGTGNEGRMKLPSWSVRKSELLDLNYGVQMIIRWLGVQGAALHKGSKDSFSFCLVLSPPFILSVAIFL